MHNKNIKFNKRKIPLIAGFLALGGMFLFPYLTLTPTPAYAAYDWEQRTLSDIDTMQQMNAKICENSEIGESKQLEDTRDRVNGQAGTGKKYWVTKLKGDTTGTKEKGECWMTQNLAYSGTNEDNIGASCTLNGLTIGSICSGWSNSTTNKYFAIGEHREAHDSRGNYYNWPAVVQGDSGRDGTQGVCPSSWQLPTSNDNDSSSRSFGNLVNVYSIGDVSIKLTEAPLFFQYNGYINSGSLYNIGSNGYYWSSTPYGDKANILNFYGGSVGPSDDFDRYYGFSVRCVAADIYPDEPMLDDNQANVAITISPVISIDVTKHANDMTVDFTKVATSTIIARVGSNQPYQVLLSTDKSDLTNPDTDKTIPMIPSDQTIIKGTSSWGIKKLSSPTDTTVNENTVYSPVGINGNKELFYTSASAASEDLTFPVAIAVDSRLPSGQYSTQVTLTAVAM